MGYNNIRKDIQKKQEYKKKLIYDFILETDKPILFFVEEYNESFRRTFIDFKKFIQENYIRIFELRFHFSESLHERGITRNPKTKTERFKDFNYPALTKKALQRSFVKMVKKWLEFQQVENEIKKELYAFAYKNVEVNNLELTEFLKKWNMADSSYFNARTQLIKKGLIEKKRTIVKKEVHEKQFDFNYVWEKQITHKEKITKYKAKSMLREFVAYYYEGRIKTKETLEAFKVLNICENLSIKEIEISLNDL